MKHPSKDIEQAERSLGFKRKINQLIGERWLKQVRKNARQLNVGEKLQLTILLNAKAQLISVSIISKKANPAFALICVNAVHQAAKHFPPIPPELLDTKSKTFEMPLTFHLY